MLKLEKNWNTVIQSDSSDNQIPKINWSDISSEDELQNLRNLLGNLDEIKKIFSDDSGIKVSAHSYKQLYEFINNCKKYFGEKIQKLNQDDRIAEIEVIPPDGIHHKDSYFFASEQHRLTYALIRLDKRQRLEMLGITDEHYEDPALIKKWFRDLSKYVHPDHNKLPDANLAWQKLEQIKNDLMEHAQKFGKKNKNKYNE
jgi:hypothetical protein